MLDPGVVRLGTRGSRLALWQTHHVRTALERAWPDLRGEPVTYSTLGDRVTGVALARVGDKGLFTRDLEDALRAGDIDAAVHSLKDLPTEPADGLAVGAVLERADAREALVSRLDAPLDRLPPGARVGTSSVRRRSQLLARRPDLHVTDIRGNVPTRIEKVRQGDYDATLLALAGLARLDLAHAAAEILPLDVFLPAPGQGALAVQVRADDARMRRLLAPLDHAPSRLATAAERGVLSALGGGCQAPVGAATRWLDVDLLELSTLVAGYDGDTLLRVFAARPVTSDDDARQLAEQVANELRTRGAGAILDDCRRAVRALEPVGAAGDEP